ncbi:snRNA-activating protein complex subunit 4 [Dendroctonus ponderosae]|uniref:snRNA-activating protein complex subunit 4 n=1 Tax=Dendroctonus ponderosae TaxID=77166 RepID=UPI002035118C|nr:snRNA-activating protein complex subunit 4 [Dendroctonus ponderosae]KAH1008922.1 hypothetical protein HUJ05_009414 [Dendroctonus ponderosae]
MEESEDLKRIEEILIQNNERQEPEDAEFAEYSGFEESDTEDDAFEFDDFEVGNCPKPTTNHPSDPMQFMTEEEKQTINCCTDPELKELLVLNRTKNIQLMQLYRTVKDLLGHCHSDISDLRDAHLLKSSNKTPNPKIWRLGMPYFKTADHFPCPRNADAIRKDQEKEILVYELRMSYKWTQSEMNRLLNGVAFQYKVNRETELLSQIQALRDVLKKTSKKQEVEATTLKIQELKEKHQAISSSKITAYPARGCEKYVDWRRISDKFLRGKYNDVECQVFWNTYLNPDINKTRWTDQEVDQLKQLAVRYNHQKWDLIAEKLGNNRTGFMCCVHYYLQTDPPRVAGRFTPEEDKRLCHLVEKFTHGNEVSWARVVARHNFGRSRAQLLYRYKYFLSCKDSIRKGKFTPAEDILILVLVDRFGKYFSRCAQYFPTRSMVQIKARYTSNLQESIKKGFFTVDEDKIILDYVAERKSKDCNWKPLVPKLKRSSAQIRQRYKTLRVFLEKQPSAGLEQAPRRKWTSIDDQESEYQHLRDIADEFQHCSQIPTLADIKKRLKGDRKSQLRPTGAKNRKQPRMITSESVQAALPNLDVDDLLTDFFSNAMNREFAHRVKTMGQPTINARGVGEVLLLLQAKLQLPLNYKEDPRLDQIDRDLLDVMIWDKEPTNGVYAVDSSGSRSGDRPIPPCLSTLYGMRGLVLENNTYKAKLVESSAGFGWAAHESQVLWRINNHLATQAEPVRNQLIIDRELFENRFFAIFTVPAIMSSVRPNSLLLNRLDLDDPVPTTPTYQKRSDKPANAAKQIRTKAALKPELSLAERLKRKIQETIKEASRSQAKPKPQKAQKRVKADADSELEDLHLLEECLEDKGSDEDDVFDEFTSD